MTEVIPGKKIAYSWRYDGYPRNSIVSFDLFEENNKTRLKLTHEGIETLGPGNPDFAKEILYRDGRSLWTRPRKVFWKDEQIIIEFIGWPFNYSSNQRII